MSNEANVVFGRIPSAGDPSDDIAILISVMKEIVEVMGARGATLTLHDNGHAPAVSLYQSPDFAGGLYADLISICHGASADLPDNQLSWRIAKDGSEATAAIIPVEQVLGHSRLLITLVYDRLDIDVRAHAEQVYRERRPFAVGFFRFWQLNRLHLRRFQAVEEALNYTAIGVVLVDRSNQILFANRAAEEMLAAADGLSKHNGALRATYLADGVNLSAALSYITVGDRLKDGDQPARAPLIAFKRKNGPPLITTIVSARTKAIEARDVAATIYVIDPQLNMAKNLGPICRLHGLSPSETELVCHLASGEPIADAAAKMHIKEQTARSYLKNIFLKTATNRQTALISLMFSSLMRMKGDIFQEALTEAAAEEAMSRFA